MAATLAKAILVSCEAPGPRAAEQEVVAQAAGGLWLQSFSCSGTRAAAQPRGSGVGSTLGAVSRGRVESIGDACLQAPP
jgi:hypothetical protein